MLCTSVSIVPYSDLSCSASAAIDSSRVTSQTNVFIPGTFAASFSAFALARSSTYVMATLAPALAIASAICQAMLHWFCTPITIQVLPLSWPLVALSDTWIPFPRLRAPAAVGHNPAGRWYLVRGEDPARRPGPALGSHSIR